MYRASTLKESYFYLINIIFKQKLIDEGYQVILSSMPFTHWSRLCCAKLKPDPGPH